MERRYNVHYRNYTENLNKLLEKSDTIIKENDPEKIKELYWELNLNGGGYKNLNFFWDTIMPYQGERPEGPRYYPTIHQEIFFHFGTFNKFLENFKAKAEKIKGNGWLWLVANRDNR